MLARRLVIAVMIALAAVVPIVVVTTGSSRAPKPVVTPAPTVTGPKLLPAKLADAGDGTQLVTAVVTGNADSGRDGVLTWWSRSGGTWAKVGSAPARFGARGVSGNRVEGDETTPTGLFALPMAFGRKDNPGTALPWYPVTDRSWWVGGGELATYNTFWEGCPPNSCWTERTRRAGASEHLADYDPQYDYAVVIAFNVGSAKQLPPARPSGSAIFIHVDGAGYTAGCISISRDAITSLLRWLDPKAKPHIAIGTETSILKM